MCRPHVSLEGNLPFPRRCFVCRQSKQQLEEEQKKALYGLENAGELGYPHRGEQWGWEL